MQSNKIIVKDEDENIENEDALPIILKKRMYQMKLILFGFSSSILLIGLLYKIWSFCLLSVILIIFAIITNISTKLAYKKGKITEIHGVITKIRYHKKIPGTKRAFAKSCDLIIQDVEGENYKIVVTEHIKEYDYADEVKFYIRNDKEYNRKYGVVDIKTPIAIGIIAKATLYEEEEE